MTIYEQQLRLEYERERERRKTKQGSFEASFARLGQEPSESWLSDRGAGADAIIAHCDGENTGNWYTRRRKNARKRLMRAMRESLPVFDLIMENGKNRKESICQLMNAPKSADGTPLVNTTGST